MEGRREGQGGKDGEGSSRKCIKDPQKRQWGQGLNVGGGGEWGWGE